MSSEDVLARRYRRLLFAYPAAYRAEREDELIGVLLDAAADEARTKPTMAERLDLARAGLRTRLHGAGNGPERKAWRDAASIVAVLLAVVLAARVVGYLAAAAPALPVIVGDEHWPGERSWVLRQGIGAPFCLLWPAAAAALALRRARVAAILAVVATLADVALYSWLQATDRTEVNGVGTAPYWVAAGILVTVVLVHPARARRGVAVVGSRGVLGAFAVLGAAWALRSLLYFRLPLTPRGFVLGIGLGLMAVRWRWLIGTMTGRRLIPLAVLVAVGVAVVAGPIGTVDPLALLTGLATAVGAVVASTLWRHAGTLDERPRAELPI